MQQQGGGKWWIVPAIIVGLVLLAFLALMGLPFTRDEGERRAIAVDETETIGEAPARSTQTPTATILEVPGEDLPATSTVAPPAVIQPGDPVPVPGTTAAPTPPPTAPTTTTAAVPPPSPSSPAAPPAASARVSESEAQVRLRSYITSRNVYPDVARSCLQIRSDGYGNEGYGFSVWQACISGGGAKRVGMWRVDAKDGSLYRRNDQGRYVRP